TTNTPRMNVLLGSTANVVNIPNAAAGITVGSDLVEVAPGSGFTLQGAGNLTLAGTGNNFTGNLITAGNGRFTVNNAGGLGTNNTVTFNNTDDKGTSNFNVTFTSVGNLLRTFGNNFVLSSAGNGGFAISGNNGQQVTLAGTISGGAAGLTLAFTSPTAADTNNFIVLANPANGFTANVRVGLGGLAITSDAALGNAGNGLSLATNDATRGGFRFDANNVTLQATRAVTVTTTTVVDTNGFNATIAGQVSNVSGQQFIKDGAGTLTLSGSANTLDAAAVRAGTLALDFTTNNDDKLAPTATVTLAGGSVRMTANTAGSSQSLSGVTVSRGGGAAVVAVGADGTGATLNLNAIARTAGGTVDFTLPAVGAMTTTTPNGAAGLLLDGAATVGGTDWATAPGGTVTAFTGYTPHNDASTLNAGDHVTNTAAYIGTVAASVGVSSLRFNAAAAGTITIDPAATLTINAGAAGGILVTPAVTADQAITGGTLTAANELIVHQYGTGALTVGSAITGAIGLTKTGPGTLVLSGANTYSGVTAINQGTLSVGSVTTGTNLGTDPTSAGTNVVLGGKLQYAGGGAQTLVANRQVTLTGPAATVEVTNAAANLTIAGVISGNKSANLIKTGPGTLTLTGANTYFGNTVVSNGTLQTNVAAGFGNSTALTGRLILGDANTGANNVAALGTANGVTYPTAVTVSAQGTGTVTYGVSANVTAATTFTGEIVLGRSITLQAGASGRTGFGNLITGTGDVIVGVAGGGTGVVGFDRGSGANVGNDFTGNVVLNAGATLMLGNSSLSVDKNIPNTANVVFNTGSRLQLSPGTQLGYESVNALVSTLPGDGAITQTSGTTTFRLTVGAGDGSGTFGGVITNTAGMLQLIKAGNGTQTFTGSNTYSGGTVVSGGTLAINNLSGSGTGTGGVTINSGGSLRGTGTVSGAIALSAGGTLAPGDATNVGTLTTAAQPVFAGGTLSINLNSLSSYGQLNVTAAGNLDLGTGNPVTLNLTPYAGATDGSFTVIQDLLGASVANFFSNYAADQLPVFLNPTTGTQYGIYYGTFPGQAGSIVIGPIAPVPEPAAVLLACGTAAAVGWWRRKRTK
ncbi:MAG TPA: autotransporter-associated beta strand repeat-containing protein, partial [Gemmataceae bacterium]